MWNRGEVFFFALVSIYFSSCNNQQNLSHVPKCTITAELYLSKGRFYDGNTFSRCSEIHKLIISIWYKGELPEEWKESIIVPIHKKGDKTDCNNYRGISLLPTTYTILSNMLLSRLIPYAEEIMGDHQCGFRRNRSTTDHIFCIR